MGPLAGLWLSVALSAAGPDRIPFQPFAFQPFETPAAAGAASADLVEALARDTYLGGSGVAGPAALLGSVVNLVVEPALGAAAALLSRDNTSRDSHAVTRSTAAAYGRTLSYMGSFMLLWALSVPVWILAMGVIPAATALTVVAIGGFRQRPLLAAGGAWLGMASVGLLGVLLYACVPWFLGRTLGVFVGDTLFEKIGEGETAEERRLENQGDLDRLLTQKTVGPLPSIRAGVLLSAVAGGVLERNMRWDMVPVVGPLVTAAQVAGPLPVQLALAREVAGLGPLPDNVATQVRVLVFTRSILLAAAQGLLLAAVPIAGATGLAFCIMALVPGLALPVAGAVLAGGLGGAAALGAAGLAAGGIALVANALLPWTMVVLAGQPVTRGSAS